RRAFGRRARCWDVGARAGLAVAALVPGLLLAFLAYQLVKQAYPSIVFNGTHFFTTNVFSPGSPYATGVQVHHGYQALKGARFGILPLLWGTLVSSVLALAIALPVSVGGAIFLVERLPRRLEGPLGIVLEMLAGIPSIVFGLWGVVTLGPVLARDVYKPISSLGIPWLTGAIAPTGQGLLTASLVLAVMIVPIVAATTRELIRSVPDTSREGAVALGLTRSEAVRLVTLPAVRTGVLAAALLGWGRALGETIAVLLISSDNFNGYPQSIFATFTTMAAGIASFLDGAIQDPTGMALHALAEVALVLLAVTLLTNFAGRLIAARLGGIGLPVGRGI
ncbi:MAG: phosphate ABC transporter permease subunit PstC, partial [Acidimicrobiales bacterium]